MIQSRTSPHLIPPLTLPIDLTAFTYRHSSCKLLAEVDEDRGMSTNAGNNDKKTGVDGDPSAVGEPTDGVPSIGSQTKLNPERPEHQTTVAKTRTSPTATTTVTRGSTQIKERLPTKTKPIASTRSNTDSTQTNGTKFGGTHSSKSKLKRSWTARVVDNVQNLFSTNRLQQGRDNDLGNELPENMKIPDKDNSTSESQPKPDQGEKTPEQHRATDLPRNNEDLSAAQDSVPIEQLEPLSITTKVEENVKQQQDRHQDDYVHVETESPVSKYETEIASLKNLVADNTTAIASLKELMVENNRAIASLKTQLSQNVPSSPKSNDKVREIKPILNLDEVTTSPIQERPEEGLVFRKADSISLTEVANLVRELNAQIDQVASLVMDLLPSRESSSAGKDPEIVWDGLHDYLGSWLCDELRRNSEEPEIDETVAHIALQAGLVHACSRIINDWNPPFWTDGEAFSRVYNNMTGVEGPITADTWRALARNYMALREDQLEPNKNYLEEVLVKLIIAVSGSVQSGEMLLQQCNEKMDDIAKKTIVIHRVISREARSTDLSTFTVEYGADFDQSRMEDTEESNSKAGPTSPSKVVCTVEMGLRGRKRVPSRQQSGDGVGRAQGGMTLKAKVVLLATLSEL